MEIARKNIIAMEKNPFGNPIVQRIVQDKKTTEVPYLLNSSVSVKEELKIISSRLDFDKHSNFIVFGIGSIDIIKHIFDNMSEMSTLTIIERDTSTFSSILGSVDISHILQSPRVAYMLGEKEEILSLIGFRVSVNDFSGNIANLQILVTPYMRSMHEEYVEEIKYYLITKAKYFMSNVGNDITDVMAGFEYTVENWTTMARGLGINGFKDSYKDIPAIIVSAGPSLDKNIKFLKKAYKKALILTVDATYQKVLDLGIIPDSISSIERYDITYDVFYKGKEAPQDSVFIAPPVVVKKVFDKFEKVVSIGRSGEFFVKSIMDLIKYDSVELGISCSHVPFAFAKYIGANPIVFIGQDLAFTKDGKTHSNDISEEAIKAAKKAGKTYVLDNDGNTLETTIAYYNFLTWFENQIALSPNTTFINATEGGAKIRGTKTMTLDETIKKYCKKEIKSLKATYDEIQDQRENISLDLWKKSLVDFITELKKTCKMFIIEINEQEKLLKILTGNCDQNRSQFKAVFNNLIKITDKNHIIRFITQSITTSYYRSVHMFPRNLSDSDWERLKFISIRHCNQFQQVLLAICSKFDSYIYMIEKEINKGDLNEDYTYDR